MSIWSKGSGRSKQLTRGVATPSVILTENFQDADGQEKASVYTVQFSTRPVSGTVPVGQAPTLTKATITWTIGGIQIQRIISIANGAAITGVGAGCSVSCHDATVLLPGVDPNPDYIVSVTLTPGSRGTSSNPPTDYPTSYLSNPSGTEVLGFSSGELNFVGSGGDTQAVIAVPQNAGVVSVQVTIGSVDGTATQATIGLIDLNGVQLRKYSNQDYPGFVPIDPQTTSIVIANHSSSAQCFWGLAFGIDG